MAEDAPSETPPAETPLAETPPASALPGRPSRWRSLSARLLAITSIFVLFAEALIFAPNLAGHHNEWLQERVDSAQIAALALEAAPENAITEPLRQELLVNAQVKRVALKRADARELRLDAPIPEGQSAAMRLVDLREMNVLQALASAVQTLFGQPEDLLRVIATPRFESGEFIEVVLAQGPLKRELAAYSARILSVSIVVSIVAGWLVYSVLNAALVRPMRRFTAQIERFRDNPEDVTRTVTPSGRRDEIGRAEEAFAAMEAHVRAALRQRERLAALGAAMARLAHDMRNSLATAQLVAERLSASNEPKTREAALRLERVITRAGGLAEAASRYGRADERPPAQARVALAAALEDAADDALGSFQGVEWRNDVDGETAVAADGEHLHRVLSNLLRNAAQVSQEAGRPIRITTRARRSADGVTIEIADAGPGVPAAVRDGLFQPFAGGGRRDGAGLGLAIARELARAMGGEVALASSSPTGAVFAVTLPAA
ncbi:MAG: sensor histidine kinase [Hyphomonadaceae bacterium]